VADLKVGSDDRERIFWRNAAKLLKLDLPGAAA
jgi:predicted TIM-barrel fold metal-dependent hydrolase